MQHKPYPTPIYTRQTDILVQNLLFIIKMATFLNMMLTTVDNCVCVLDLQCAVASRCCQINRISQDR